MVRSLEDLLSISKVRSGPPDIKFRREIWGPEDPGSGPESQIPDFPAKSGIPDWFKSDGKSSVDDPSETFLFAGGPEGRTALVSPRGPPGPPLEYVYLLPTLHGRRQKLSSTMPDPAKSAVGQDPAFSSTRSVVVKKYTCMYTTDLQKHRKVWHDGFIRMRHVNSKVYLISEGGHTLAESFMKLSSSRAQPASNPDRLNYMKVHPEFSLDEDEQIEFDPAEDSELRPSSYMARIVELVKVEAENVPLLPPLNTNARQDLHKRKMEYLDQTIQQFSKRPKPGSSPQAPPLSDPITPSTPVPAASRRKMAGFESRPFNSPLLNKSRQAEPTHSPALERLRPPSIARPTPSVVSRSEARIEDPVDRRLPDSPGPKARGSSPPLRPRPRTHPAAPPPQPKLPPPRPKHPPTHPSTPRAAPSSSSARVSNHKPLKVDWDSLFQAAKPA
ncbi:hypothetical protein PTTG_28877 [Puccinia triticina 1-1 BBBD Race 1]|uniref:DUF2439 domain-containing protein n=1 Tax=Puccinia triticina (isolate 1-1 / race 1 (BBBD)) TaxID=630390 RepID=A0A180GAH1_PUCT1|nr:hypothetical protein PTTG_28877 [Puccinia triticina 1-1 BBBD Race 1]